MNILLSFNSNYYMPALVLLQSLLVACNRRGPGGAHPAPVQDFPL